MMLEVCCEFDRGDLLVVADSAGMNVSEVDKGR